MSSFDFYPHVLMKYLIAGLGNIGVEYAQTRHNIGFMVLDALAKEHNLTFDSGRHAFYAVLKHKGRSLYCIKPTTYMNLSGKAVQHWLTAEKIPLENLLVIMDDLAIPFGKLRMRKKGSAAGHNGLKDIEQKLGTNQYCRLRFGIGDDYPRGRQVDYVLGEFFDEEQIELPTLIEKAGQMILSFAAIGADRTMSQFND